VRPLPTDPVKVVDYDATWPDQYAAAAKELRDVLDEWVVEIEHIGSTAVPGLAAKPVIDIQVGVRSLDDSAAMVAAVESLGYEYAPEFEDVLPERRFFRRWTDGHRSHHVHLVERANAGMWDDQVLFRDRLRTSDVDRDRYAALKQRLAECHRDDRQAYTDAKAELVREVLTRSAREDSG